MASITIIHHFILIWTHNVNLGITTINTLYEKYIFILLWFDEDGKNKGNGHTQLHIQ